MARKPRNNSAATIANAKAREAEAAAKAATAQAEAEAAKARAQADAERARAEAETARIKAEAETRAAELKAESDRRALEAQQAKEAADNSPWNRAYKIGVNAGAVGLGMWIGHKFAASLEARHVKSMQVAAAQVKGLATEARRYLNSGNKLRLPGIVKAAEALKYAKVTGPLGVPTAALLLIEGAYTRFVLAPEIEGDSPAAAETLRAVGTASTFAATGLLGFRALQNQTPKILPSGRDMAAINNARDAAQKAGLMAADAAPAAARAAAGAGKAAKALKVLGKVSLWGTAAYAAINAGIGYADDGVRGAARGVVDALDPSTLFVKSGQPGLAERAFNRAFGKSPNDHRAAIAASRKLFARAAERRGQALPAAPGSPALPAPPGAPAIEVPARKSGKRADLSTRALEQVAASRVALGRAAAGRAAIEQATPMLSNAQVSTFAPTADRGSGNHKRGFQNAANLEAALRAQGKRAPGAGRRR
jgi:hypothetical protein